MQLDMEMSAVKASTADTTIASVSATATVSAGVLEDFEAFIEKFTATQSVRYEQFLEIWKELQMSLIFAGRQSDQECREVYFHQMYFFKFYASLHFTQSTFHILNALLDRCKIWA